MDHPRRSKLPNSMQSFGPFLEQWSGWVPIPLFVLLALLELTVGHGDADLSPMKRVATNVSLYVIAAVVAFAVPLTIASAAAWAGRNGVGLFNTVPAPALLVLTIAILGRSFAAYWLHRASHRIPLLWRYCIASITAIELSILAWVCATIRSNWFQPSFCTQH